MHAISYPKRTENVLVPYPIISAAVRGKPDAANRVIQHYFRYIAAYSTRISYDTFGNPHFRVDEDMRRRLETKLIHSIVTSFKVLPV